MERTGEVRRKGERITNEWSIGMIYRKGMNKRRRGGKRKKQR